MSILKAKAARVMAYALEAMAAAGASLATGCIALVALRCHAVLAPWLAWAGAGISVLLLLSFPLFGMPIMLFVLWTLVVGGWRLLTGQGLVIAQGRRGVSAPA